MIAAGEATLRDELVQKRERLLLHVAREGRRDLAGLLQEVDAALERVESGDFGRCEVCHDPIERDRLLADPTTRVCLGCLTPEQSRALEHDLATAAAVQRALLPPRGVSWRGWEIHYEYRPFGPVSGDHCDLVVPSSDGGDLHFLLGDVAGKGVAAALLMTNLHALFRSLIALDLPIGELLARANRLFPQTALAPSYASLVAGRLSTSGRIELGNAGHCPPIVVRRDRLETVRSTGLPLGLFQGATYESHVLQLAPGDALVLYSDGLSEAPGPDGEVFGDRLLPALAAARDLAADRIVGACLDHLGAFAGGAARMDDLTMMAIRRTSES